MKHALTRCALLLLPMVPASARAEVVLAWPVACDIGSACEIQHYVDHSGEGEPKDFRCGTITYKGHNGTDIRVLTMAEERRGVAVRIGDNGGVITKFDEGPDLKADLLDAPGRVIESA